MEHDTFFPSCDGAMKFLHVFLVYEFENNQTGLVIQSLVLKTEKKHQLTFTLEMASRKFMSTKTEVPI